ncbi:MAG: GNAT family N-acetyltransferase [Flavobacteriaceae bacterium]
MAKITFRKFTPEDAQAFKDLNIEWLSTYFVVEAIDELVLGQPQKEIINRGGHIFMAEENEKVIGTFAFLKKSDRVYEFSKMAIDPTQRGKGYGTSMLQFALRYAEQHHWEKIVLYSSTKLKNALHIYRKFGFIEVPLESNTRYSRSDIKMVLLV